MSGKISEGGLGVELPASTMVLLVEGQKFQADIVRNALVGSGIPVDNITEARDVTQALELLKNIRPDIIISEMDFTDASGEHLARETRNLGITVPLIAVTAAGESFRVQSALDSGFNDYLLKPVSNLQITKRVLRHLRQSQFSDMPAPSRNSTGKTMGL